MITISLLLTAMNLLNSADSQVSNQDNKVTSIGIYLDVPEYDQSAFALMEQTEDAMQDAFPDIPWQTIDSTGTKARTLPAPLPLLGKLTQAKPDSQVHHMGKATAKAYGYSHLLLIQRGGTRAARDSSPEFGDAATFTLIEANDGRLLFQHNLRSVGRKAAKNSAEAAWAQSAWKGFVNAWKTKPQK